MRARAQSASDKLASIPAPDRGNGEAHIFGNCTFFFLFSFSFGKIVLIRLLVGHHETRFSFFFYLRELWNYFLIPHLGFMKHGNIGK